MCGGHRVLSQARLTQFLLRTAIFFSCHVDIFFLFLNNIKYHTIIHLDGILWLLSWHLIVSELKHRARRRLSQQLIVVLAEKPVNIIVLEGLIANVIALSLQEGGLLFLEVKEALQDGSQVCTDLVLFIGAMISNVDCREDKDKRQVEVLLVVKQEAHLWEL